MNAIEKKICALKEPQDYFRGIGKGTLPCPTNILIFSRLIKEKLQQEAPQNRSHHRFVLVLNLQTSGHIHVDHLSLSFSPGQALLIHPYQFHHFSQLASRELKWLICTFELEADTSLEPLRDRVVNTSSRSVQAGNELLEEWLRCSDPGCQSELQDAQLQAALVRLLLALRRDRLTSGADLPQESGDSLLRTINRLMAEWRGRPVAVADLAKKLNLSESRLRAVFKEAAGIPLGSYIQNYRLNRAMSLLRTTDFSIADIAEKAGFGSPQAFCRTFKKETENTPRSYRRKE
jgi:AraC-like DNA-binding protein